MIIVSSTGGMRASPGLGAYNVTKAADFQLARGLAFELGPQGLRVNCIAPGLIRTDFARALWDNPQTLNHSTALTAVQLGPQGIRVNCIAPGQVWTPMVQALGPEARERRRRAAPLATEGTGWDVGWGAVYLASDEARWVTGHILVIDAGLTATTR